MARIHLCKVLALLYVTGTIAAPNTCELNTGWRICPAGHVTFGESGVVQFGDRNECIIVPEDKFPTTILAAETDIQKRYENPYQDMNLLAIPDLKMSSMEIGFSGTQHYTRWFILDKIPAACDSRKTDAKRYVQFRGIQYKATITFVKMRREITSGVKTGHETTMCCGMYQRKLVQVPEGPDDGEDMSIIVVVMPPPIAGTPSWHFFGRSTEPPRGQGGDHEIARNGPVAQFSLGWDWSQHTPDRHTGIWDKVFLVQYGGKETNNQAQTEGGDLSKHSSMLGFRRDGNFGTDGDGLWIDYAVKKIEGEYAFLDELTVKFNLIDANDNADPGERQTHAPNVNGNANAQDVDVGVLHLEMWELSVDGSGDQKKMLKKIEFHQGDRFVLKRKHFSETGVALKLNVTEKVRAWWPQRYGNPVLHKVIARLHPPEKQAQEGFIDVSQLPSEALDIAETRIGFRTFTLSQVPQTSSNSKKRVVNVPIINGKPVFITGGNWIAMDQFLRKTGDWSSYYENLWLHRELGFEMIRVWGGALTERPEFYQAADDLGLLIWQEFWMTGDNNGRWAGDHKWPDNYEHYTDNAKDMMTMLHNHCSLVIWCLGNELDGLEGGGSLNEDIYNMLVCSSTYSSHQSCPSQQSIGMEFLDRNHVPTTNAYGRALQSNAPYVLRSSMGTETTFDAKKQATAKDGPYGTLSNAEAFKFGSDNVPMEFNPEAGAGAIPSYDTFAQMFSQEILEELDKGPIFTKKDEESKASKSENFSFENRTEIETLVMNSAMNPSAKTNKDEVSKINQQYRGQKPYLLGWHNYLSWTDDKDQNWILDRYGAVPRDLKEFCKFANLAHFEQVRLLFEGRLRHMGVETKSSISKSARSLNKATTFTESTIEFFLTEREQPLNQVPGNQEDGLHDQEIISAGNTMLLYWKSQSPWPSFRGFLYDWNKRLTGGFYGSRAALIRNYHIFAEFPNEDSAIARVYVSNRGFDNFGTSTIEVSSASGTATPLFKACAKVYRWNGTMYSKVCQDIASLPSLSVLPVDFKNQFSEMIENVKKEGSLQTPMPLRGVNPVDNRFFSIFALIRFTLHGPDHTQYSSIRDGETKDETQDSIDIASDDSSRKLETVEVREDYPMVELDVNEYLCDSYRSMLGKQAQMKDLPQLVLKKVRMFKSGAQIEVGWQQKNVNIQIVTGVHMVFENCIYMCDTGYFNLVPTETRLVMCVYLDGPSTPDDITFKAVGFNVNDSDIRRAITSEQSETEAVLKTF